MAVAPKINVGDDYKERFGFFDPESYVFKAKRGLNEEIVREISDMKNEPDWMLELRLAPCRSFARSRCRPGAATSRSSTSTTSTTT